MGITLKIARLNAGLTQKQASERVGVSELTIRNWEHGKTYPTQPKVEALRKAYKLKKSDKIDFF